MLHTLEPGEKKMERLTEKDYRWNFIVNSLDYAFFSLGMTLGSIFTLFPVFARNLGASNLELGLIPAIANLGWGIPAIWGAKYAERSPKKLNLVLKVTLGERLPYLFMALISFYLAVPSPRLSLYLSILMVGIATFSMGFLGPPWMSMMEKVIDPRRRGTFLPWETVLERCWESVALPSPESFSRATRFP